MSEDLFADHGLDPDATLAWARERAAQLLAGELDAELAGLLAGVDLDAPARVSAQPQAIDDEPTNLRNLAEDDEPSVEMRLPPVSEDDEAADEDIEEIDFDDVEELDDAELELIEEVDENEEDYTPVRTGDTAPHAAISEPIAEDGEEEEGEEGAVDDGLLDDLSIPIDLDDD